MALPARKLEIERTYTVEEFELLPEFDECYELVDGKLIKKAMPGGRHSLIIDRIRNVLKTYDPQQKLGYSLQEASVRIGKRSAPIPDMSYWKAERNVVPSDTASPLPDLAVEVLSPSDVQSLQSAMIKVYRLLMAGVPVVWVVDPKERNVTVYHAVQAEPMQTLSVEQELDGEDIIPGFKLSVAALFE